MSAILPKLTQLMPNVVLDKGVIPGVRDGLSFVRIDAKNWRDFAKAIRESAALGAEWLENMSVAEVEGTLIVTYFFSAPLLKESGFAVRIFLAPRGKMAEAELPSVRDLWGMAESFENDASELFGVFFVNQEGARLAVNQTLVPSEVHGDGRKFPLRKDFQMNESRRAAKNEASLA